jgi:hypothetical protein
MERNKLRRAIGIGFAVIAFSVFVQDYIRQSIIIGWLWDERVVRNLSTIILESEMPMDEASSFVSSFGYKTTKLPSDDLRETIILVESIRPLPGLNFFGAPFNRGELTYVKGKPVKLMISTNP